MPKLPSQILNQRMLAQTARNERHKREVALLSDDMWATVYLSEQKRLKNPMLARELLVAGLCEREDYFRINTQ